MVYQTIEAYEANERRHFTGLIEEMEEDEKNGTYEYEMPHPHLVKYHDLLGKLWGWARLLPIGDSVSWSHYSAYLKEYHSRNVDAIRNRAALAQTCVNGEEQLVSELMKMRMKSEILPMRKSIVLSCLIHQRVLAFIRTGCSFSDVLGAALLCIAKEADLMCQLLRCGADPVDDYWIDQGREIRTCALSLMNCTSDKSVVASAVMLGMAKEAEMMCEWMSKNNKHVDFDEDLIPAEISDCHRVRYRTLDVMVNILEESSAASHKIDKEGSASRNGPGGDGNGITADGAENPTRGGISDVLNSQYKKKFKGGEDRLEKLWGWKRLLPLSGSVKWDEYRGYLEDYYEHNASEFVAGALADPDDSKILSNAYIGAALAKSCLKMEEELLSEWKTRVRGGVYTTLPISTIIQSSLIKELALSILRRDELFAPSDVAFVVLHALVRVDSLDKFYPSQLIHTPSCITKEADLMCEMLKHGAKPFDDVIQQSCVIRMCALGLADLKGHRSISAAATMMGMANEAKKMCDWIKREKKIVTFSLSQPHDLEGCCFIRIKALDVMTSILHQSSFPCPEVRDGDDANGI